MAKHDIAPRHVLTRPVDAGRRTGTRHASRRSQGKGSEVFSWTRRRAENVREERETHMAGKKEREEREARKGGARCRARGAMSYRILSGRVVPCHVMSCSCERLADASNVQTLGDNRQT